MTAAQYEVHDPATLELLDTLQTTPRRTLRWR